MTDFEKFKNLLYLYKMNNKDGDDVMKKELFESFVSDIQELECNDFRRYYYLALYQNKKELLNEAKTNIDNAIRFSHFIIKNSSYEWFESTENRENSENLIVNQRGDNLGAIPIGTIYKQLAKLYFCAGEIYSKLGLYDEALEYYKIYHYYQSFFKSDFSNEGTISLYSFRPYSEYSLADLTNNTITVSPSSMMNDPFDSIINMWATEEHLGCVCSEKKHIKPYHDSFGYYRIRCFCKETNNPAYKNVLMWSHYADEHKGFCIRYNLSKHFICQAENDKNEHMYLKKIIYNNDKIDIDTPTIDSNLAYATKKKQWEYENEVRLIVYNPNHKEKFYGIELDKQSYIDAIYFGYRCPEQTIETIKNLFKQNYNRVPRFYKMTLNLHDIYNMNCVEI